MLLLKLIYPIHVEQVDNEPRVVCATTFRRSH